MKILLCTYHERDKCMLWCTLFWFAARNQVRSGPPNSILDDVRQKGRQDEAYEKAEDCDVHFVYSRLQYNGPENHENEGNSTGIEEEVACAASQPWYVIYEKRQASLLTGTRSTSACGN